MTTRTLALVMGAISLELASTISAQHIVVPGPVDFRGILGNPLNTVLTGQSPVTTSFTMGSDITVASAEITLVTPGTFAKEAMVQLINSAFPSFHYAAHFTTVSAFSGTLFVPAGTVRPWITDAGLEAYIPVGSTWELEFFEAFDDSLSAVDSTGANIDFTINPGLPPPVFDSGVLVGPYSSAGAPGDVGNGLAVLGTVGAAFTFGDTIKYLGSGYKVISSGALSEARLRLRSSTYPGLSADFQPINAVYTTLLVSPSTDLTEAGSNLLRGLSIPSGSTMSAEFFETFDDGPGPDSNWVNIQIKIMGGATVTPATPPNSLDLGTLTDATLSAPLASMTDGFGAGFVAWYKFTLSSPSSLASGHFLDIWTSQPAGGFSSDTVLSLYDTNGKYICYNDNGGGTPPLMAAMSFGGGSDTITSWTPSGHDLPFQGQSGEGLPAGDYYLAVTEYPSGGRGDGFSITGGTTASNGTIVNFRTNLPAIQTLTGNLILGDTAFSGASTRNIAWSVMQGTTNLGSGTIVAGAPSTAMNLVVASATGSAELILDGSSFLKRKVNLTLTNSNQAIGNATMQNGDVDNSGEVDAADIDQVISSFGDMGNSVNDVDVTDEVDAADIDIVIANFGGMDD